MDPAQPIEAGADTVRQGATPVPLACGKADVARPDRSAQGALAINGLPDDVRMPGVLGDLRQQGAARRGAAPGQGGSPDRWPWIRAMREWPCASSLRGAGSALRTVVQR